MVNLGKQQWSCNGVIVTVYKESSTTAAPRRPQKIRATHLNPTSRSCGYDSRAELLAYAHHLRNLGPQHIDQDHSLTYSALPKPKKKRRLFARLKALKFSFRRIFGAKKKKAWIYESIQSIGCESKYQLCPSRRQGRAKRSKISKKLYHLLEQCSFGCKSSKRFGQKGEQRQDLHRTN